MSSHTHSVSQCKTVHFFHHVDAEIMTLGIPAADPGSQISTTDGLYLLEGMEVTSRGEAVALEMDVERGGFVDVKVLISSHFLW